MEKQSEVFSPQIEYSHILVTHSEYFENEEQLSE
jgi:hypothetical protein